MSKPETGHTPFPDSLKWDADNESIVCGHEAVAFIPHSWREHGPLIVEAVNSHAVLMAAARALRNVLASAFPKPLDHPSMFKAWNEGKSALAELKKAGIL